MIPRGNPYRFLACIDQTPATENLVQERRFADVRTSSKNDLYGSLVKGRYTKYVFPHSPRGLHKVSELKWPTQQQQGSERVE